MCGKGYGAPGMRPNFNKVVYYQYLSEMSFWKSGPKSGPLLKMLGPFAIRISVTVLIFSPWDKDCKKNKNILTHSSLDIVSGAYKLSMDMR
jgi:hypothetical protein